MNVNVKTEKQFCLYVQESLLNENLSLSNTVKKLNRDVSKVC